MEDFRIEV